MKKFLTNLAFICLLATPIYTIVYANIVWSQPNKQCYVAAIQFLGEDKISYARGYDFAYCKPGEKRLMRDVVNDSMVHQIWWYDRDDVIVRYSNKDTTIRYPQHCVGRDTMLTNYRMCIIDSIKPDQ